jgi:hypothetical protein
MNEQVVVASQADSDAARNARWDAWRAKGARQDARSNRLMAVVMAVAVTLIIVSALLVVLT